MKNARPRSCGGKMKKPAQRKIRNSARTTQPCHLWGRPQPQPYRFAGNQCAACLVIGTSLAVSKYAGLEQLSRADRGSCRTPSSDGRPECLALLWCRNRHSFKVDAIQLCVREQARVVLVKVQEGAGLAIENARLALDQSVKGPNPCQQRLEAPQGFQRCMLHAGCPGGSALRVMPELPEFLRAAAGFRDLRGPLDG